MPRIELACLDMTGTTVSDDDVVGGVHGRRNAVGIVPGSRRYATAMAIVSN